MVAVVDRVRALFSRKDAQRIAIAVQLRELSTRLNEAQLRHEALALRNEVAVGAREIGLLADAIEYEL